VSLTFKEAFDIYLREATTFRFISRDVHKSKNSFQTFLKLLRTGK